MRWYNLLLRLCQCTHMTGCGVLAHHPLEPPCSLANGLLPPCISQTGDAYAYAKVCTTSCPSGQYVQYDANSKGTCTTCSNPPPCASNEYRDGTCSGTTNGYQCRAQPACSTDEHLSGSSSTTRGTCTTCSNAACASNEYRGGTCTGTTNGYQCNTTTTTATTTTPTTTTTTATTKTNTTTETTTTTNTTSTSSTVTSATATAYTAADCYGTQESTMCGQLVPQSLCQSLDAAEKTLTELHCPVMCCVCTPPLTATAITSLPNKAHRNATGAPSPASTRPATTDIKVAASADPCHSITCAALCEDECGWSRSTGKCAAGLETSASEMGLGVGCPDEEENATSNDSLIIIIVVAVIAVGCGTALFCQSRRHQKDADLRRYTSNRGRALPAASTTVNNAGYDGNNSNELEVYEDVQA